MHIIVRTGHADQRGLCVSDGLEAHVRRDEQWWEGGVRVGYELSRAASSAYAAPYAPQARAQAAWVHGGLRG